MATTAPDDLQLTRGHYAALRAHLQGLSAATIAGIYLGCTGNTRFRLRSRSKSGFDGKE
jgi:hypothetical protein